MEKNQKYLGKKYIMHTSYTSINYIIYHLKSVK